MVSTREGRVRLTRTEAEVMACLARGPAELGPRTEEVHNEHAGRVSIVARRPTRSLQRAGLVWVDVGGVARLTVTGRAALMDPA